MKGVDDTYDCNIIIDVNYDVKNDKQTEEHLMISTNTNTNRDKYMIIFSMRLAGELMAQGFHMINMRPDIHDPNKKVYIFNNSSDLQNAIYRYKTMK